MAKQQSSAPTLKESAQAVPMEAGAPLAEAGRAVLAGHLRKLLQALPVAQEGSDPEGVHEARVATRRLRATLAVLGETVYKPRPVRRFRKGLGKLATTLGVVRDADVFLLALDRYGDSLFPEERAGLEPLYHAQQRRRDSGRKRLLAALDGRDYEALLTQLRAFVTTPEKGALPTGEFPQPQEVRHFASSIVWGRYEAVRAYEGVIQDAPIPTLHALRLEVKRLRYIVELFHDALGQEADPLLGSLREAQEHLGNLNDADLAIQAVDALPAAQPEDEALQRYRASRVAEQERLYQGAWWAISPLYSADFRTRLANALAAL